MKVGTRFLNMGSPSRATIAVVIALVYALSIVIPAKAVTQNINVPCGIPPSAPVAIGRVDATWHSSATIRTINAPSTACFGLFARASILLGNSTVVFHPGGWVGGNPFEVVLSPYSGDVVRVEALHNACSDSAYTICSGFLDNILQK